MSDEKNEEIKEESPMDVLMSDWADYNQMIREGIEDGMPREPKEGEDK